MPLPIVLTLTSIAIVRRADIADSALHVDASAYPATFGFPEQGECAATLIDESHALTAAHCFSGCPGCSMPMSVTLTDSSGTTHSLTIAEKYLNPCYDFGADGPNGADLAVMRFSSPVPSNIATPVTRYSGTAEVDSTFTLIGWGNFGPAGACTEETCSCSTTSNPTSNPPCTILREGRNVFETVTGNVLTYSLTAPGSGALSNEAIAWSGDSGGPAFLDGELAGINSGGDCCAYGSVDQFVRVSGTLSSEWISATIAAGAAQSIADCAPWASTTVTAGTPSGSDSYDGGMPMDGDSSSNGSNTPCFPSLAKVTLADGTVTSVGELRPGDRLITATASGHLTTDVVSMLSLTDAAAEAHFVKLTISASSPSRAGEKRNLTLTADHHLAVGSECCSTLKQAKQVVVGSTVWITGAGSSTGTGAVVAATVSSIAKTASKGLHSPVTVGGTFPIVDGVVTAFDSIGKVTLASYTLPWVEPVCKATGTCGLLRVLFGRERKYIA